MQQTQKKIDYKRIPMDYTKNYDIFNEKKINMKLKMSTNSFIYGHYKLQILLSSQKKTK